ncbi:MAG: DUF2332 domain-containing protein [Hyphomonas sp.]|nr:DUF2332 domain-containing protein [Hyphomonas sp.]
MIPPPTEEEIVAHFREQAVFCAALGSPFMGQLCEVMAADIEAGGPVATLVSGWPGNPRRDALSLRIAGYLHHSVLTGAARDLAAAYPAQEQAWTMDRIWPLARDWLAVTEAEARVFLQSPPQTNEVRRSIALLPGFLKLAATFPGPMHLLELGASAGLNQNWDRFTYRTASWSRPGTSGVVIGTDWNGPPPEHLEVSPHVASRAACDQNPIDVSDPETALRLKSYVWPDQPERLARIDAAIALAAATGVTVDKADAADWLTAKLAARPASGLTVIYHSVFLQYPPAEVRHALRTMTAAAGAEATPERPLAWLCFEPGAFFQGADQTGIDPNDFITYLKVWPGGSEQRLLRSDGHVTQVFAT